MQAACLMLLKGYFVEGVFVMHCLVYRWQQPTMIF